jgi:uncharacterized protein YcfJ
MFNNNYATKANGVEKSSDKKEVGMNFDTILKVSETAANVYNHVAEERIDERAEQVADEVCEQYEDKHESAKQAYKKGHKEGSVIGAIIGGLAVGFFMKK